MANRETKELVNLGVNLVNVASEALKDGKIDLADAFLLVKVLVAAGPAIDNVSGVLAEIQSWSPAERDEVLALIREIDLPDDQKEKLIEKVLQAAVILAEVILPLLKSRE